MASRTLFSFTCEPLDFLPVSARAARRSGSRPSLRAKRRLTQYLGFVARLPYKFLWVKL